MANSVPDNASNETIVVALRNIQNTLNEVKADIEKMSERGRDQDSRLDKLEEKVMFLQKSLQWAFTSVCTIFIGVNVGLITAVLTGVINLV